MDGDFKRPYLKLVFKNTGKLKYWSAGAGGIVEIGVIAGLCQTLVRPL